MPPVAAPTFPPELVAMRCPRCGTPFDAQVVTVVDAGDEAALQALLGGRLNVVTCPSCGNATRLATLLLYFDLEAEVALLFAPAALARERVEQERRIGQLTGRVLAALPSEARRMYLAQPRLFVTEDAFYEAVLEANGMDAAEIRRLRESADLVESLLAIPDEAGVRGALEAAGRTGDTDLVAFVDALAHDASAQGANARAGALLALRDRIGAIVGPPVMSLDTLVDRLRDADADGSLDAVVAEIRPVLDYTFFARLTEKIAGTADEAGRTGLTALRETLLRTVDAVDAQVTARLHRGADTVRALLDAPDPGAAIAVRAPALDGAFFAALESATQQASGGRDAELGARLADIRARAVDAVESGLPARDRLVNRLARTSAADRRAALLDAEPGLVDVDLEGRLRHAAFELRAAGASAPAGALAEAADEVARRLATEAGARP